MCLVFNNAFSIFELAQNKLVPDQLLLPLNILEAFLCPHPKELLPTALTGPGWFGWVESTESEKSCPYLPGKVVNIPLSIQTCLTSKGHLTSSNHLQLNTNGTADAGMPTSSHLTAPPGSQNIAQNLAKLPYPTQGKACLHSLIQKFPSLTQILFSVFRTSINTFVPHEMLVPNKVRHHTVTAACKSPHLGQRTPCFQRGACLVYFSHAAKCG